MGFNNIIENIAKGFEFEKGEIVLLHFWGDNKDLEVLDKLAIEIGKSGAVPMKLQQSREFIKDFYSAVEKEDLVFPEKYFEIFKIADSVIDIMMYPVPAPHVDFPKEKINEYRTNMINTMRNITEGKRHFIQLRVPTLENSQAEEMEFEEYNSRMLKAYDIDYTGLKKRTRNQVGKFNGIKNVELITGEDARLTFCIENRPWHLDDGIGDMPCGEVYIAPIEESVFGEIVIPKVFLEGEVYENVKLTFHEGELQESSQEEILTFAKQFPGASTMFSEFGIGMNPNVNDLCGYTLLDEKCSGTCHIAIGMNDMFGGKNSTPFHFDFVFKPKAIKIDGNELKI